MAIYSGFTHWKWWLSIAMLVYQRVTLVSSHIFQQPFSIYRWWQLWSTVCRWCQSTFFLTVGQGDENQNLPRLGFFLNHRHLVGKWEQTGNQTTRGYITPPWNTLLQDLPESLGSPTMSRRCLLHLWPSSLPFCPTPRWLLKWLAPTNSPGGHEIFHDFHLSSCSFVFHTLG